MKKEYVNKCLTITKKILIAMYQGNTELATEHIHEKCLWIGPLENQFCNGKKKIMSTIIEPNKKKSSSRLQSQEFLCVSKDRHQCIITGRYIAMTDVETDEIFRSMQRATVVWKLIKGKLCIMHVHISIPKVEENGEKDDNDENFPHPLGRQTKEYLNTLLRKEVEKKGCITVKDYKNIHHIIQVNDIICCESFDTNTIIHTVNGDVFGKIMLVTLEKILVSTDDNMFIRVHKSFIVNKHYVKTIQRFKLNVANKYQVSVSKERYLEIKDKLFE